MYFFLMTSQQGNASLFDLLTPFIVIFFIMWFLVIRPQKKEQKKRQEMLDSIKKGDKIVTNGGIVGKITKIKENKIEVKVDDSNNVKITFLRFAINRVLDSKAYDKDKEKENE